MTHWSNQLKFVQAHPDGCEKKLLRVSVPKLTGKHIRTIICMCCISQVLKIKQCNTKLLFHYPLPQKKTYWFWKKTIKVEPWYNRAKVGKMCSLCLSLIVSGFFSIFILLLLGLGLFYLCWRCWSNRWIQAVKFSQCRSYCCACGPVAAYYTSGCSCSVMVS